MKKPKKSDIDQFIALPDSAKQRIASELDAETAQQRQARSRPLNAAERRQWRRFKAKTGRPKVGSGAGTISLTVEKDLLRRADAFAKKHDMSRAKLVAEGLKAMLGSAA